MANGINRAAIAEILKEAIENLFIDQPNIFEFTVQTGQTEWNLGHHLAHQIYKFFPWFDYDLDVVKREYENKRPDIIFHRRGTNDFNFLVVEIKFNRRRGVVEEDRQKIIDEWFREPLSYQFGAVVHLRHNRERCEVEVLENERNPFR